MRHLHISLFVSTISLFFAVIITASAGSYSNLLEQSSSISQPASPRMQNINGVEKGLNKVDKDEQNSNVSLFFRLLQSPGGVNDTLINNDSILRVNSYHLQKRGNIIAYHPYWLNRKKLNYNFSIISTFAFYGYSLDAISGGYNTLNGWDTLSVISKAVKAGCKVDLCVYHKNLNNYSDNLTTFLLNPKAQQKFSETVCEQLKLRGGNGVNIMFEEMDSTHRDLFSIFIRLLSNVVKSSNYKLTVTIPALDNLHIYDIPNLNPYVDQFVIDFTKKREYGSIAPLKGTDFSIESTLIRALKSGVKSSKYIACIPFYGALWNSKSKEFIDYIPYNEIEDEYLFRADSVHSNNEVFLDLFDKKTDSLKLFYDDTQTLAAKYDYILKKQFGGIGIWALGYDNFTQDLSNVLLSKILFVDTCEVINIKIPPSSLSVLQANIIHEFSLYEDLFQHPCNFNSQKREDMIADDYVGYLTLALVAMLIFSALFYIFKARSLGDDWVYKKVVLGILITLLVLTMCAVLMFCFLSPSISSFGITLVDGKCETSFGTVLQVLGIGFLIGTVAMKFLILPLLKRKEIP